MIDISTLLSKLTGTVATDPKPTAKINLNLDRYHPFRLPIEYTNPVHIHPLSATVAQDVELVGVDGSVMGNAMFQPSNVFGQHMIPEWTKTFSTDVGFLQDTQLVVREMGQLISPTIPDMPAPDTVLAIWKELKENPHFLEQYNYIEWDMLKHLNQSSAFLQLLSVGSLVSPVISLVIPMVFMVLPFVILKLQRVPITFELYVQVLKDVAKNHFIGKAISNLQTMSLDKIGYVIMTGFLYVLQIYQNVISCSRFYKNIQRVHRHLVDLRTFLTGSVASMTHFGRIHGGGSKLSYMVFCDVVTHHRDVLQEVVQNLIPIPAFSIAGELGYLLKCYYDLHTHPAYAESVRYAMGFEGYLDNLRGVHRHLQQNTLGMATFDGSYTEITEQFYPPSAASSCDVVVKNTCSLDKNIIITGPNASGKTTLLKTTTLNIIFTQMVGCGFYTTCQLNPYTDIHSYLNIPDTSERDSLFQAEARRCKDILDTIRDRDETSRHFCIFDELYSGTNPVEAIKAGTAFLNYLSKHPRVDFMLTTHYVSMCKKFRKSTRVANYKMLVLCDDATKTIQYTYRMKRGISKVEGAIRILEDMDYPTEILNEISAQK